MVCVFCCVVACCVPATVRIVNKGPVSVSPKRSPRPLPAHTVFTGDKRLCLSTLRLGITHSLALSHPSFSHSAWKFVSSIHSFIPAILSKGPFYSLLFSSFTPSLLLDFLLFLPFGKSSPFRVFCRATGSQQEHRRGTQRPRFHSESLIHTHHTSSSLSS